MSSLLFKTVTTRAINIQTCDTPPAVGVCLKGTISCSAKSARRKRRKTREKKNCAEASPGAAILLRTCSQTCWPRALVFRLEISQNQGGTCNLPPLVGAAHAAALHVCCCRVLSIRARRAGGRAGRLIRGDSWLITKEHRAACRHHGGNVGEEVVNRRRNFTIGEISAGVLVRRAFC